MKNRRATRYLDYLIFLLVMLTAVNCQKEDDAPNIGTMEDIGTVGRDEALALLEGGAGTGSLSSKLTGGPYAVPDLDAITREKIRNSKAMMTVVPVRTKDKSLYSRIIMLKMDGGVRASIIGMTGNENEDGDAYTGKVFITDLDGNLLAGYVMDRGTMTAVLVQGNGDQKGKKTVTLKDLAARTDPGEEGSDCPYSDPSWCQLDEVTVTGSSSGGGSGGGFNDRGYVSLAGLFPPPSSRNDPYAPTTSYGPDLGGGYGGASSPPSWNIGSTDPASLNFSLVRALGITNTREKALLASDRTFSEQVRNYLYRNKSSQRAFDFAREAVKAKANGGSVDFEDQIINGLINKCARDIFKELENGIFEDDPIKPEIQVPTEGLRLNFSESILKLFNESNTLNYSISNGNLSTANATTTGAHTTISTSYLKNATKLSIARTMIHEVTHAYLNVRYSNPMSFNNGIDFRLKMEKYARDNGIVNINSNKFHHEFMGQYINAMAYSLKEWDKSYGTGGNLDWEYYRKMASAGLVYKDGYGNYVYSESFKKLFPTEKERKEIEKILNNEKTGNKDAKGTKC